MNVLIKVSAWGWVMHFPYLEELPHFSPAWPQRGSQPGGWTAVTAVAMRGMIAVSFMVMVNEVDCDGNGGERVEVVARGLGCDFTLMAFPN
jgi:hypothetical protein